MRGADRWSEGERREGTRRVRGEIERRGECAGAEERTERKEREREAGESERAEERGEGERRTTWLD